MFPYRPLTRFRLPEPTAFSLITFHTQTTHGIEQVWECQRQYAQAISANCEVPSLYLSACKGDTNLTWDYRSIQPHMRAPRCHEVKSSSKQQ